MTDFFECLAGMFPSEEVALIACLESDGTILRQNDAAVSILGALVGENVLSALQRVSTEELSPYWTEPRDFSFICSCRAKRTASLPHAAGGFCSRIYSSNHLAA